MKKKTFVVFIVILLLLAAALVPYKITKVGDSGTKVYKSLVYEITVYNEKIDNTEFTRQGVTVTCFGKEIVNSTSSGMD